LTGEDVMLASGDHPMCLSSIRLGGVFTIAPGAAVAVRFPQTAMYRLRRCQEREQIRRK